MGEVYQKLRDSANGQQCTLRLPGICQGGTETTVLCHCPSYIGLRGGAMKVPDWWSCYGCVKCHDVIDGRNWMGGGRFTTTDLTSAMWAAIQRTHEIWFEMGLLRVAGDDEKPRTKHKPNKIVPRPAHFRR